MAWMEWMETGGGWIGREDGMRKVDDGWKLKEKEVELYTRATR